MRAASFCVSAFAVGVLAACSGKVTTLPDVDGGTREDAASDAAPPPTMDAAPPPPPTDGAMPDCAGMAAQLDAVRTQAKTCCPICNTPQCDVAVQDVCCPFSVTGSAPAGFEELVAQYKSECHPACPAIPCMKVPSNTCKSTNPSNPSAMGICQ